jgi:hypothetical protein
LPWNSILAPILFGNTNNTFLNWSIQHEGPDNLPAWNTALYLDEDEYLHHHVVPDDNSPGQYPAVNVGPFTVSGGRHSLASVVDLNGLVPESNEGDNAWIQQFVWSPYVLLDQDVALRDPPPNKGTLVPYNCDGFQHTGGWWGAVGILPLGDDGDDYDVFLFNDYATSTVGFGIPLTGSAYSGTNSDFVLFNGNILGFEETRWAGVVRYAGGTNNVAVHASHNVGASMSVPTTYGEIVESEIVAMGDLEVVKVHEVYLDAVSGITYSVELENLSGTADLNVTLYDQANAYFSKDQYVAIANGAGGGGDEGLTYKPLASGWYGIAVWKRNHLDVHKTGSYKLRIGPALSNLNAIPVAAGWSSPAVPRSSSDASAGNVVLTPGLPGNTAGTYVNWGAWQEGPNIAVPTWSHEIYLDVNEYIRSDDVSSSIGPGHYAELNYGPLTIRGGRHSLTVIADPGGLFPESDETDNQWSGQWVWSPFVMTRNVPRVRAAPPDRGSFPQPNSDGFQFTRGSGLAWVSAMAPEDIGDDYDLYVYDDYSGSTSGFSNLIATSELSSNMTDYVVGHRQGTPTILHPAAIRSSIAGGGGPNRIDQTDALGRSASDVGSFTGETMSANRLADVYEGYFEAGSVYEFWLLRRAGSSDILFSVYPSVSGDMWARGLGGAESGAANADNDTLTFTANMTGWHPIVVCRHSGVGANTSLTYDLTWQKVTAVDVPLDGPGDFSLALHGAFPNPVRDHSRIRFELAQPGPVSLAVYDLRGRKIRTLADGAFAAGIQSVDWNGSGDSGSRLSSGIYWLRLDAGGQTLIKRVALIR